MHPRLVELGFIDYINSVNDGFIFTIDNIGKSDETVFQHTKLGIRTEYP